MQVPEAPAPAIPMTARGSRRTHAGMRPGRCGEQVLAWALFAFISVFALTNSLRMASIIAKDQATARADRQTEGVRTVDHALDVVRTKRDEGCGPGRGKLPAY
jgi:hypothetical protein